MGYLTPDYWRRNNTDYTPPMEHEFVTATTSIGYPICKHKTGWYGSVKTIWNKIFGGYGIQIYTCSLCGRILQGKELKEFRKRNCK
jgi:hypothetical protein